jgi:hypothetical protein
MRELSRSLLAALGIIKSLRMNDENRIRLYETARSFIGTDASPNDLALDELGCAETVTDIVRQALGDHLRVENRLSTYWLYKALRKSENFKEVFIPIPGLIVIFADRTRNSTEPGWLARRLEWARRHRDARRQNRVEGFTHGEVRGELHD